MKKIIALGIGLSVLLLALTSCTNIKASKIDSLVVDKPSIGAHNHEADIDVDFIKLISDALQKDIIPYEHLGVSIDRTAGLMIYDGQPVREIWDGVAGAVITESMGIGFTGRNVTGAVDLTVVYENGKPIRFNVSTQEEYDKRTAERQKGENLDFAEND